MFVRIKNNNHVWLMYLVPSKVGSIIMQLKPAKRAKDFKRPFFYSLNQDSCPITFCLYQYSFLSMSASSSNWLPSKKRMVSGDPGFKLHITSWKKKCQCSSKLSEIQGHWTKPELIPVPRLMSHRHHFSRLGI